MKRFISIVSAALLLTAAVFAQDNDYDEDEIYDDGYVYEQNGIGDQFLKIDFGAYIPLNFGKQLNVGLDASVGYYRFITQYVALGGEIMVGYNPTIGSKSLITWPMTFGVMVQPYFGKFEFPFILNVGMASTTCQSMTYFPSLAVKFTAGAYYRYSETWSFGISSTTNWIPQWFKDSSYNDNGFFTNAGLSVRYHF